MLYSMFDMSHDEAVEFSQVPFWFWNDELSENEIDRQLAGFQSQGVHAFVIHPRAGLPRHQGWMSREWLSLVRFAVDRARERGMWVLLYDEAMYPSGSSGGQVVAENPAYACRGLVQIDLTAARPGETVQRVKIGAGGVELAADQTLVADVTRRHDGHRIAIVDLPIGSSIRGVHYIVDDPPRRDDHTEVAEEHPPAGDLLNPEAMQCFIRLAYQKYFDALTDHFGTTVKGIFTDEPHVTGRGRFPGLAPRPGTTGILEHVNAYLGYDFAPHLPALWDDGEPDAARYRNDYDRAIRHRLQETYYRPISEWCEAHGVALTGHPAKSDDIGLLKYFQIPGQDVVLRFVEPDKESAVLGPHSTMAKCASSAMLHAGRRRNMNEFAGAYGHGLTFDEYRWLALWLLVRGCNMLSPHAFYYSVRGPRIDERPRDVGPNSPWWHRYKDFAQMTGTLCWLNTDSTHLCRVAILGQGDRLPWLSARVCLENQIDFNYLEDDYLLRNSAISDAGICVGPMHYELLIVEEGFGTTLGKAAEAVIERLEAAGRVVRWAPGDAGALLQRLPRSVRVMPDHTGLRIRQVRKKGAMVVILFNEGGARFEGRIAIEGATGGQLLDMDTGNGAAWSPQSLIRLDPHACAVLSIDPSSSSAGQHLTPLPYLTKP